MNRQDMAKLFWRQGKVNIFFFTCMVELLILLYIKKGWYKILVILFFNIFTGVNLYIKLKKKAAIIVNIFFSKSSFFWWFWPCTVCQEMLSRCGIQTVWCLITIMFFIEGCHGVRFIGVWDFKRNGDQDRRYRVTQQSDKERRVCTIDDLITKNT